MESSRSALINEVLLNRVLNPSPAGANYTGLVVLAIVVIVIMYMVHTEHLALQPTPPASPSTSRDSPSVMSLSLSDPRVTQVGNSIVFRDDYSRIGYRQGDVHYPAITYC